MPRTATIAMLLFGAVLLSACSAMVLATGTDEEEIIRVGTTAGALQAKLGPPLRIEALDAPLNVWNELRGTIPRLQLLVAGRTIRDESGKYQWQSPADEAVSVAYYRFEGRLKRTHDVGEAVSLDLMTLGLAEVFLTPAAAKERGSARVYLLTVWLDASGKALAYLWEEVQLKGEPA